MISLEFQDIVAMKGIKIERQYDVLHFLSSRFHDTPKFLMS